MPKATLTYDLIEESYEHQCAVNGAKYRHLVEEIMSELRKKRKYGDDTIRISWYEAEDFIKTLINDSGVEVL